MTALKQAHQHLIGEPPFLDSHQLEAWTETRHRQGRATRVDMVVITHPQNIEQLYAQYRAMCGRRQGRHGLDQMPASFSDVLELDGIVVAVVQIPLQPEYFASWFGRLRARRWLTRLAPSLAAINPRAVCLDGCIGALTKTGLIGRLARRGAWSLVRRPERAQDYGETFRSVVRDRPAGERTTGRLATLTAPI